MEHVIIRLEDRFRPEDVPDWFPLSIDGELFDLDALRHSSTFTLCALGTESGPLAYLPVEQPLMLESLITKEVSNRRRAIALTRLVEYAIGEAFRRDVGEIYFLTRDQSTRDFAERHHFKPLPDGLVPYRLNLCETFGETVR